MKAVLCALSAKSHFFSNPLVQSMKKSSVVIVMIISLALDVTPAVRSLSQVNGS